MSAGRRMAWSGLHLKGSGATVGRLNQSRVSWKTRKSATVGQGLRGEGKKGSLPEKGGSQGGMLGEGTAVGGGLSWFICWEGGIF